MGGSAGTADLHGHALWEAKLEVELCHRALALLRLQLSSAQEDVDDLQVCHNVNGHGHRSIDSVSTSIPHHPPERAVR